MIAFSGYRKNPPADYIEKGISAAGSAPDYEGVVFDDGSVAVRWLTKYRSTSVWSDWKSFYEVHGHPEYDTHIVWNRVGNDAMLVPGFDIVHMKELHEMVNTTGMTDEEFRKAIG